MHHPFAPYAPNLFAVGLRDDMLGQHGNHFSPYVRLFTSLEEAEKHMEGTVLELFEYCVNDPDAAVRQQDQQWAYIKANM